MGQNLICDYGTLLITNQGLTHFVPENDMITLKARAKTAAATKKINEQIAKVDSSGTIAMLEKMRARVEEDESLASAYGEMASVDKSVDDEINAALSGASAPTTSQSLLELKKKMGITSD